MEGKKFQNMEKDFIPHEGAIALRGKKKRDKPNGSRRVSKTKGRGRRRGRETWRMKTRSLDVEGRSARGEESFN